MKLSFKPMFVLLALAAAMGTLTLGCSPKEDDTKPGTNTSTNPSVSTSGGAGAATPPKTHD